MIIPKLATIVSLLCLVSTSYAIPQKKEKDFKHVLLISIDGLHQVDVDVFTKANPESTIAKLLKNGVYFKKARTSLPSDSFPGLLAQLTGGSPATTGVWYDDAWDGTYFAPGSKCNGTAGYNTVWDESLDMDPKAVVTTLNETALPLRKFKGKCEKVQPYQFLRVNTIFEVAKKHGLVTAWSDKLPAYSIVRGPSGKGVDDLFVPEINGVNKTDTKAVEGYDTLHINAVLNWINGLKADGSSFSVPAIFGANFQSISVTQKAIGAGYKDAAATPSDALVGAFKFVDDALKKFVDALKKKDLENSTIIILSAKHGQSPIDITKLKKISAKLLSAQVGDDKINQLTTDDVALFWLKDHKDSKEAAEKLRANATTLGITTVYEGSSLKEQFGCEPTKDTRCPDIAIKTNVGVIYTTSATKIAEHGGFNEDDIHVPIIVSNPSISAKVDSSSVDTRSIAPFILSVFGINPHELEAVVKEKTETLPVF
ncbi:14183_t:CDS:2 [Acaulospora morrowiae]|uniref:14183_t:CDS:1 n=1 Tax=Acaulospora morrowiae TaxID=94023 RepID=A0A9N8VIA7_9GLOM|nr:14183_t:CDS:2 [Acaulospora morrowiae]